MFIKVQFYQENGGLSKEYSYECPFHAQVGDNVRVRCNDSTAVGRISRINVPESELGCKINHVKEVLSVSQNANFIPAVHNDQPSRQISLEDLDVSEEKPQESLIVIKQLPIIEERLHSMKAEIEKAVGNAMSLAVTEDTVKQVKKVRADLNAKFKELEDQRKAVKNQILAPYNDFEAVYAECVTNVFSPADKKLKEKIDSVEDGIKEKKTESLRSYFEEYRQSLGIDPDVANFESCGIKPNLSSTDKALRTQAQMFLDIVKQDIDTINGMENAAEILAEYRKTRRLAESIQTVNDRHARIEEEKRRMELMQQEEAKRKEAEAKVIEAAKEAAPPVESAPEQVKPAEPETPDLPFVEFRVYGTIEQLKALKKFMIDGGYKYEQL